MKTILLFFSAILASAVLSAQTYTPLSQESTITFKIKNLGFNTGGSFSGLKGTIQFNPATPENTLFDITINANTVNTDNEMRDSHLQGDSYFDTKNYPVIHFVSEKVEPHKNSSFTVSGKLTIKKTTKDLSFPFTATKTDEGYVFDGEFKINRRDFDVGGSGTLSDKVVVNLHVISKK